MKRSRFLVPAWGVLVAVILGLGVPGGRAQETPRPKAEGTQAVANLATRFRFQERYGLGEESKPDAIGPYRVGIRATFRTRDERPQRAPEGGEVTVETIYTERPAQVSPTGLVLATVRRYDAFRRTPDPAAKPSAPRPLTGLTLWYQPRPGGYPQVLSLTEGRGLRDLEHADIIRQVFLPELATVLPTSPKRKGDQWSLSKGAMRALLGETPGRGAPLLCELDDVRMAAQGPNWEAILNVTGRVFLEAGETSVNGRVVFTFSPPTTPEETAATAKTGADEEPLDARGAITELRMATAITGGLPGASGRLRRTHVQEVIVARQLDAPGAPLTIPDPPPQPTEANSWLTYDDPMGQFHLRHPQDLLVKGATEFTLTLVRQRTGMGPEVVEFQLVPKTGDAAVDRENRSPEFQAKMILGKYRDRDPLKGPAGWLPEADWAAAKMKVYRMELAIKAGGPLAKRSSRIHLTDYLALFGRDESLLVEATTVQDSPTAFRKEVESILKTFQFGSSKAR